jgi:predicted nucleic acid-binding protein
VLNLVQQLPLWLDSQADSDATLELARAHGLTVYDAVYLELALRRHLPLVTFDVTLAEAARRANVVVDG